jgi:hypothetical protein
MRRRFTFPDSREGRQYFRLVYEALVSRGSQRGDQRQSKDDHRSEARILKALKRISLPLDDLPKPSDGQPDLRLRQLACPEDGNAVIELEQPDWKRLCDYVEQTQWAAGLTDLVVDLEDALDAAEKIEEPK